ncbi:MAG: hypothetical protein MUF72_00735 [Elainella sp. Prado103]|jgi:hypothetical protein|nr:hypothetical protein [Elainella sp. Prado103]
MLNWSLGLGGILGIALALSGVALYFLRTMRPNLARDHDIFFAAVALLCGGILVFQSWRLDPILQFAQFLSIGSAVWFAYEAVRLRGIATEQAKRSTPVIDDERPVSRVYRAELDELTPLEEQRNTTRRIRGSRDRSGEDNYGYEERGRRRSSDYRADYPADRDSYGDSGRRSSRPLPPDRSDDYRNRAGSWDDPSPREDMSASTGMRESIRDDSFSPRNARRGGRSESSRRRGNNSEPSDYVDYQPIDYPNGGSNPNDEWR